MRDSVGALRKNTTVQNRNNQEDDSSVLCIYTKRCNTIFPLDGVCVYMCVYMVFIKLNVTAQSGPVVVVILCHSH